MLQSRIRTILVQLRDTSNIEAQNLEGVVVAEDKMTLKNSKGVTIEAQSQER
jgi:hypothetical protein